MTPIESILYMIWRGIAVGVLISAPMGPVGILCIQRTLDKGRHAGFYTGIGAAISDIFYCLLTGFGLSFIEDFLESNQNVIQLVGSLVLIAFSIYLFRKDPSSPLRRPVPENVSAKKNILGGFLFTFSNPLIIFLIIGLFARFNFMSPEIKAPYYVVGYLFIVGGALGWWFGITYAIDKVRSRFNMRSMKMMNIGIGVVILIFAGVGIVTSIVGLTSGNAHARKLHPQSGNIYISATPGNPCDTLDISESLEIYSGDALTDFQADIKLRPLGMKASVGGRGASIASLLICGPTADAANAAVDSLRLDLRVAEHSPTPISSADALMCDASLTGGICVLTADHITASPLQKGVSLPAGWNHYRLICSTAGTLQLLAGNHSLQPLLSLPGLKEFFPFGITNISVDAPAATKLLTRDVRLRFTPRPQYGPRSIHEVYARISASTDPVEGIWSLLDWSIDEQACRLGGEYRVAIAALPDAVSYDIIYISGAVTNASQWAPGMIKGRLTPAAAGSDLYQLEWIDAGGVGISHRMRAQFDHSQRTLTLFLPYADTTLRFQKE